MGSDHAGAGPLAGPDGRNLPGVGSTFPAFRQIPVPGQSGISSLGGQCSEAGCRSGPLCVPCAILATVYVEEPALSLNQHGAAVSCSRDVDVDDEEMR